MKYPTWSISSRQATGFRFDFDMCMAAAGYKCCFSVWWWNTNSSGQKLKLFKRKYSTNCKSWQWFTLHPFSAGYLRLPNKSTRFERNLHVFSSIPQVPFWCSCFVDTMVFTCHCQKNHINATSESTPFLSLPQVCWEFSSTALFITQQPWYFDTSPYLLPYDPASVRPVSENHSSNGRLGNLPKIPPTTPGNTPASSILDPRSLSPTAFSFASVAF